MEKALPGSDGTRRRRTGRGALPAYVSRDFIITNLVIGLLAGATVGSVGWLLAGYWRPDATFQFGTAGPLQRFSSSGELREFLVSADVLTRGSRSPASLTSGSGALSTSTMGLSSRARSAARMIADGRFLPSRRFLSPPLPRTTQRRTSRWRESTRPTSSRPMASTSTLFRGRSSS